MATPVFPLITGSESFMYFNLELVFLRVLCMRLAGNLCRIHFSSWLAGFSIDSKQYFVILLPCSFASAI